MSEREEVSRFDFEHPPCKGYGCCGGGGMAQYEDGEFVRYTDYAVVQKERDVWEREAVDGRAVLAHHKARSDEMHRLWTAAIAELEKCDAERITAERERDEARRERDEARTLVAWANNSLYGSHSYFIGPYGEHHIDGAVEALKSECHNLRRRAERAERVVEAAKRFDAAWYVASVTDEGLGLPPLLRCVPEIRRLCEAVRALDTTPTQEDACPS